MRALIAAATAMIACYGPGYRDCEISCSAALGCPDGLSCLGGFCRTGGAAQSCTTPASEAGVDTPAEAGSIYPTGPFNNPVMVPVPGAVGVEDPTVTSDLLQLYFSSNGDIHRATRNQIGQPWGNVTQIPELVSMRMERDPDLSTDGRTLMFSSDRNNGNFDLYVTTQNTASTWDPPLLVSGLQGPGLEAGPSQAGELHLAFESDAMGSSPDLYTSSRLSVSQPWGQTTPLTPLNTAANEGGASLSPDRLTIYFHSNTGSSFELYEARRPDTNSPFGNPMPLATLNTPAIELDPWVSPDGHYVIFVRVQGGGHELWEATR